MSPPHAGRTALEGGPSNGLVAEPSELERTSPVRRSRLHAAPLDAAATDLVDALGHAGACHWALDLARRLGALRPVDAAVVVDLSRCIDRAELLRETSSATSAALLAEIRDAITAAVAALIEAGR